MCAQVKFCVNALKQYTGHKTAHKNLNVNECSEKNIETYS